jgi:hypothetical protein
LHARFPTTIAIVLEHDVFGVAFVDIHVSFPSCNTPVLPPAYRSRL